MFKDAVAFDAIPGRRGVRPRIAIPYFALVVGFGAGDARASSPTFQRLTGAVASGRGLVFIEEGVCAHGVPVCLLLWVQRNGAERVLMIRIDPRKSRVCALVASIGHELHR